MGGPTLELAARDFPVFVGDAEVLYESPKQFLDEVAKRANRELFREQVRKAISDILS